MSTTRRHPYPVLFFVLLFIVGCSTGKSTIHNQTSAPNQSSSTPPSVSHPSSTTRISTKTPVVAPQYIDSLSWVSTSSGLSLHVIPTRLGRDTSDVDARAAAWAQVVELSGHLIIDSTTRTATVNSASMQAQFFCHWDFARLVDKEKPSWNLEPWRPAVSDRAMIETRCNPGKSETDDT